MIACYYDSIDGLLRHDEEWELAAPRVAMANSCG